MMFSPHCCDHYGMASLHDQLADLRADNRILRDTINIERSMNDRNFYYAKTPSEQEILDLITRASQPLDELKGRLGVK